MKDEDFAAIITTRMRELMERIRHAEYGSEAEKKASGELMHLARARQWCVYGDPNRKVTT